jgi:AcrR family transcriptional regulator
MQGFGVYKVPKKATRSDSTTGRAISTQYDRSCYLVNMPSQQKRRADGERTRQAIVREAVSLATLDGLEGLSIGNLAAALDMSKSGIYAHFGSKQDLQLATVDEAERIFQAEVIEPALAAAPGLAQLIAVCDAFFDHLMRRTFPGGCFFAGAALEMGTRPGPVKEQIAAFQGRLTALIRQFIVTALEQHQLAADEDPDALTFELNGIILAANTSFVLREDPATLDMARNVVRRRLGVATTTTAPTPTNGTKSRPPKRLGKRPEPTAASMLVPHITPLTHSS